MSGVSGSTAKLLRGLSRRKVRASEGLFLAEGVRVVEELLDAGLPVRHVLVSPALEETERGGRLLERLEAAGPVGRVRHGDLLDLADTRTSQGVLVAAEIPAATLEGAGAGTAPALVLDAVQDPGNLGTLARSAAAFGCGALVCLPGTVDPWNPRAVRASAGALFRLAVVSADVEAVPGWLADRGFTALGADAAGESIATVPIPARPALVVGNEGAGLGSGARSLCSGFVSVPMRGGTESLNVAVATGILLYLITRGSE
ncbi:MAG TPA: RNA methyltransferase [Longimicrobiales bacterium]|nr:RNA methyltransferase [Longimicrobiales bacterium]